jgi:lipopolysaccharide transport system ATP-binding protein
MSDPIVRFEDVGKMYKIFPSRVDNLLDALGLARTFRRDERYREFWALRDISLELAPGEKLGIIGRNGAGKSTLLKLVTGNFPPTEGRVEVQGEVQALLEIGGGLHPEFTGRENIRAALGYMGLSNRQIADAEDEIADFTELGRFLEQPFKTYSQGMQARLSFAIATTTRPQILIVDEILGAGDAYFFTRSTARMRELIEGGAAVLLVSHALDQIVRFCDEAIWLDRGRIVLRGPSMDVVKAYERFIRELEDRRLLAKNRKARARYDAFDRETYTDQFVVQLVPPAGGGLDIREVVLEREGAREDSVRVGDAQDADTGQTAFVSLDSGAWSAPQREPDGFFRRVETAGPASIAPEIVFNLWFYYGDSTYVVDITYRTNGSTGARAMVRRTASGEPVTIDLPAAQDWRTERIHVGPASTHERAPSRAAQSDVSRWPGEGSLKIADVRLVDSEDREQAVFNAGSHMRVLIDVAAERAGEYPLTAAATMYRVDGILITNHVGGPWTLTVADGDTVTIAVDFGRLNLGNGRYVFSLGLYRRLSAAGSSEVYDLLDRSYEFELTGNAAFDNGVFSHPAEWTVDSRPRAVAP